MGVIKIQAIRGTVMTYAGALVGLISTLLVFPIALTTDENGLFRILVSVSLIFAQFSSFGVQNAIVRFFPYFKTEDKKHHGFIFYPIVVTLIGFLICIGIFYGLKDWIVARNIEKSKLFVDYLFWIIPLAFVTVIFNILDAYARSFYEAVIGSTLKEFVQRLLILVSVALYYFKIIDFNTLVFYYVLCFAIPSIALWIYIQRKGHLNLIPDTKFLNKHLVKEMVLLCLFSILTSLSTTTIATIDSIMVNSHLGLSETGIYSITFYIGASILIPARAVYRISSGVIADALHKEDHETLLSIYKKSCLNQLLVGSVLFLIIWLNIDDVFKFLPAEYSAGKYVVLFICIGNLADMAAGVNGQIMANSKYFRADSLFMIGLVVLTVLFNYLLIPIYGITGSAIATALTLILYNFFRFIFIWMKFKMQPFDKSTLMILLVSAIIFFAIYLIPDLGNKYANILIRSALIAMLYLVAILKMNLSEDIKNQITKHINLSSV